jgi:hypothetical protein
VPLINPSVVLGAPLSTTLTKSSSSFAGGDTNSDGILGVGEAWTWTLNSGPLTATTIFTATGHGLDPLGKDITFPCYPGERVYVPVIVIKPNTMVEIAACTTSVYSGDKVMLAVTDHNFGDVPLTGPRVVLSPIGKELVAPPSGGDINQNGILDVGESWWWLVRDVEVNATTTFTAIGHGFDPLGNDVTYPAYNKERAEVTVTVYIRGDANEDGVVNMADVTRVERIILGLDPPTRGADANEDNQINMADVTRIENIILGIPF